MDMNREVSASKAAAITGCSNRTISSHCDKGTLAFRKKFNRYLIKLSALKHWAMINGLDFDLTKL